MYSSNGPDLPPFSESVALVEFLTTAAGAFADLGLYQVHDPSEIRSQILRDEQPGRASSSLSTLRSLNQSDFFEYMVHRYGEAGISLNLLRLSLIPLLSETGTMLGHFGNELISKSNLLFNRQFLIFLSGSVQKKSLYSSVIIEMASLVAEISENLDKVIAQFKTMIPHCKSPTTDLDIKVDELLSNALGFNGVRHKLLLLTDQKRFIRNLSEIFHSLSDGLAEFTQQLRLNQPLLCLSKLTVSVGAIQEAVVKLSALRVPEDNSLESWDYFRQSILIGICQFNNNLFSLCEEIIKSIPAVSPTVDKFVVSVEAKRGMTLSLLAKGVGAMDSESAVNALIRYCELHDIGPEKIIPGEVSKIHQYLSPACLEELKGAVSAHPLNGISTEEKMRTLNESTRLEAVFKRWQNLLAPVVVIFLFLIGNSCGVKTDPKSDIDDFRPKIPFKTRNLPASASSEEDIPKKTPLDSLPRKGDE